VHRSSWPRRETAYSRDLTVFDSTVGARFPNPKITAEFGNDNMPQTGDNVAQEFGIDRAQADLFAARSQARYEAARASGFFVDELLAVSVPTGRKTPPHLVEQDEHPRPQSNLAALARLQPLNAGGVVTAGNASGVNDGAVALLIGSAAAGERLAWRRWRASCLPPPWVWHRVSWVWVRSRRSTRPCREPG
jgi:acetyl-CoA acetyltransferase